MNLDIFDHNLAEVLFNEDKMDELIIYCNKAAIKYPNNSTIKWYEGLYYYKRGEMDTALEVFNKLITLDPSWREAAEEYINTILRLKNANNVSHSEH